MSAIEWRTSSYSAGEGACVEVSWRTSSYSAGQGECVEVAPAITEVRVRDTKDREGGQLTFPHSAWRALTDRLCPAPSAPMWPSVRSKHRRTHWVR